MLNKKMTKLLTLASILSLFPMSSHAYEKAVTIDPTYTYGDGLWKPGRELTKKFNINNNREEDIVIDRIYIQLTYLRHWKEDILLDESSKEFKELSKYSNVTLTHDGEVIYKSTLEQLVAEEAINIPKGISIQGEQSEPFEINLYMDEQMGNDAEALDVEFILGVSYSMDDEAVVPPKEDDDDKNNDTDKLPQTGGIINSTSITVVGVVAISVGAVLNKKSDKKGGKDNE